MATICWIPEARATNYWSDPVFISKVDVEDTGSGSRLFITFNSVAHNTNCAGNGSGYWQVGPIGSTENIKRLLGIALAASLARRSIRVMWNDDYTNSLACSGIGTDGYPLLRGIEIW
jgi:hypothetical protein